MSIKPIMRMGHPVLKKVAALVTKDEFGSAELNALISDLLETMRAASGIGLAAPQINISKQVAVIHIPADNPRYGHLEASKLYIIINPVITALTEETHEFYEGCLSVPGLRGLVKRPNKIRIDYVDENNNPQTIVAHDFLATVFQHEIDHLFGKLYVQRMEDLGTLSFQEEYDAYHLERPKVIPDSTAVRVALWRAMHVQLDAPPHVLQDEIGLQLVAPDEGWRDRPDMHPQGTRPFRASIVARARFIEDLVEEESKRGLAQYVILGAGLDTFAQRKPETASQLEIFEVEKKSTLEWKRQRLIELGFQIPKWLHFVSVNFESNTSWWKELLEAGFDLKRPAVVTSIGVSMYLTRAAIGETLQLMTGLAPGSIFVMTFMLPLELVAEEDRFGYERSLKGAEASGTPFISFFSPQEMLAFAREIGLKNIEHFSTSSMAPRYFSGRTDGLRPSTGEELLIVTI